MDTSRTNYRSDYPGSANLPAQVPGRGTLASAVHLVAAYAPDVHGAVAQVRVDGKTNEHKAARQLLGILPISGKVITGGAMFTQRDLCAAVIEGGGDYILPAKENQPTLLANIAAVFAEPEAGLSPPPSCTA